MKFLVFCTPLIKNLERLIQFSSVTQSCPTLCDPMDCSTPGFPVHHQLQELAQTHVHWVGDATQPSHPLLLLPSIFPRIRVFSNESALHIRCPKYWSFSFSISPSNEYSGLISFRIDWLDLLAVQGTLKSLLQHHTSTTSVLQCLAFFMVLTQLSHICTCDYWKNHSFDDVRPLSAKWWQTLSIFNMLSTFVIAFLPRSKHLSFPGYSHHLQWFWSPRKSNLSVSTFFLSICQKWWDLMP